MIQIGHMSKIYKNKVLYKEIIEVMNINKSKEIIRNKLKNNQ